MSFDKPEIDFEYLAHVCQGDKVFMKEMIEAFVESIPQYTAELKHAYEQDQKQRISELIHKLKPLLMYLKLDPIYKDLKALESLTIQERAEGEGLSKMTLTFAHLQVVISDLKLYLSTNP